LRGLVGDLSAADARATLRAKGTQPQTAGIHAGGGYLSRNSSTIFFGGLPEQNQSLDIELQWPDGRVSYQETGGELILIDKKQGIVDRITKAN